MAILSTKPSNQTCTDMQEGEWGDKKSLLRQFNTEPPIVKMMEWLFGKKLTPDGMCIYVFVSSGFCEIGPL
jgi:hypothetical protein